MSSRRALRTATLLSTVIASIGVATIAAADANVCALPASALYFMRTASATPVPAGTPARNATAALSSRASCWSQSAGITIDSACLTACACRRIESEATANRNSRLVGVCLKSSATFKCSGSGVSDCSTYALNADGSSTLKAAAPTANSTQSPVVTIAPPATPQPSSINSTIVPVAGANSKDTEMEERNGLAAWAWALIVVGIVFAVALSVFAINWVKHRPRYTKHASEHTDSMDDPWRGGGAQTPAAAMAARTTQVPEPTPVPVAGMAGVDYHTYRLGSTSGQVHRVYGSENDIDIDRLSVSRTSDGDSSSIELHSPQMPVYPTASSSGRRSSMPPPAGRTDRAANDSQLSYATSDGSYRSGVNSFSSQITLTDLESRESDSTAFDGSYVRKRSTEF